MPTADLAALREALPWWVNTFAWIAVPSIACLLHVPLMLWCARCNRTVLDGSHWTEIARQQTAGTGVFRAVALANALLVGMLTYAMGTGHLTPGDGFVRAAIAALVVWLVGRWIGYRRARQVLPWMNLRAFVDGQLFLALVLHPVLYVVMGMMLLGPSHFEGSEVTFVLVYGGGVFAIAWFMKGGGLRLLRWLGRAVPADERFRAVIAEVERRTGHRAKDAFIVRAPIANAAALPVTNEVLVTSYAKDEMTDEQLVAVMLHEYGHLRESRRDVRQRMAGIGLIFALAFVKPAIAALGVWWWLAIVAVCFALAVVAGRAVKRLETQADEHAHAHADDDEKAAGLYARSLERMYELNLTPAVLAGKAQTHPHLYDRMLAAGVTPDYERPEPPPKKGKMVLAFSLLTLLLYTGELYAVETLRDRSEESESLALFALTLSGGDMQPLSMLADHWRESQPERARILLEYGTEATWWAEFPARLACLVVEAEPEAARRYLAMAEERCAHWDHVHDELREWIDFARERLGMEEREW